MWTIYSKNALHIIKADHLDHLDYLDHPDHPDQLNHTDHPDHPDHMTTLIIEISIKKINIESALFTLSCIHCQCLKKKDRDDIDKQ